MIIQAIFGSVQSGVGYQFYDVSGTLLGSRVTSGIALGPGGYIADATVPDGAVGVYWSTDTSEAAEDLREALAPDNTEVITAIGSLNDLSAAEVRTELTTELGRIDTSISSRNASTPPTVAAIADAVWDEALSGHSTSGTTGAQLTAAGAAGDPWSTTVPAAYADGTAGAALGRLNNTPAEAPVLVIPAPDEDESLSVLYIYTEAIDNTKRAGIEITVKLVTSPSKSERVLEATPKTMTTDADGFAQLTVQRGLRYRVTSRDLKLDHTVTPADETLNLLTLIP